jgi:hypothetical protein
MKISREDMTQEIMQQYLDYSPTTGHLTWKTKHTTKVVVGRRAGSVCTRHRHRVLHFMGTLYAEHRFIWRYCYGTWPTGHIDHINHDEQDNRIANLRDVSQTENNMNSSFRSDNSSGHTGVWVNKLNTYKKFMAELSLNGVRRHYSSHYTLEDAIAARKQAEQDWGFHPNHGIKKPLESSTAIENTQLCV